MAGMRRVAECLGVRTRPLSVHRHLMGFTTGPITAASARGAVRYSVREHFRRVRTGSHVNLNLIRVGGWRTADWPASDRAIRVIRELYLQASITVGRVERYVVPAEGHDVIESMTEVEELMMRWSVPNDGIDCFIVDRSSFGLAPPIGTCLKNSIVKDGVLAPLTSNLGQILAHELCHFFGLPHVEDDTRLMDSGVLTVLTTVLIEDEIRFMNASCAVRSGFGR